MRGLAHGVYWWATGWTFFMRRTLGGRQTGLGTLGPMGLTKSKANMIELLIME